MTREHAMDKLIECRNNDDTEAAHIYADDVLCDLLSALGYEDVVDAWRQVAKWYS